MTDRELIQPEQEPVAYVCWSNPKNADGTLTNFRSSDLWVAKCVFAREIEAKLKEKND